MERQQQRAKSQKRVKSKGRSIERASHQTSQPVCRLARASGGDSIELPSVLPSTPSVLFTTGTPSPRPPREEARVGENNTIDRADHLFVLLAIPLGSLFRCLHHQELQSLKSSGSRSKDKRSLARSRLAAVSGQSACDDEVFSAREQVRMGDACVTRRDEGREVPPCGLFSTRTDGCSDTV